MLPPESPFCCPETVERQMQLNIEIAKYYLSGGRYGKSGFNIKKQTFLDNRNIPAFYRLSASF